MRAALLAATLLASHVSAACLIRGVVVDGPTGKALAKTKVYATPRASGSTAILRVADEQGGFCFDALEPSSYSVTAQRTGYLRQIYGAKPGGDEGVWLNVDGRAELPPLRIPMLQAASIGGTILDAAGEPMENIVVELLRKVWDNGWSSDSVVIHYTDDRGAFRFAPLPPGTYYISVAHQHSSRVESGQVLDEKGQPAGSVETPIYYASSFSFAHATPIPLETGQQIGNLVLTWNKVPPRRLSGRLSPEWGVKPDSKQKLVVRLEAGLSRTDIVVPVAADGSFSVEGLAPWQYTVTLLGQASDKAVDLSNGDINGFILEPEKAFPVRFAARVEGRPMPAGARLELRGIGNDYSNVVRAGPDGTYLFPLVTPGTYGLEIKDQSLFLKSVVIGGETRTGSSFELRDAAPGVVQAVFSAAVARVEGKVDWPAGKMPALATTVVWIDEARSRKSVEGGEAEVDEAGKFELDDMGPGTYRLFAIEGFDVDLWGSPELAAALGEKSVKIEVKEGDARQITLPSISPEDWAKALRKVGM